MPVMQWNSDKRNRLSKRIAQELDKGADENSVFEFDGEQFVVGYAKYLVQYLDIADPE